MRGERWKVLATKRKERKKTNLILAHELNEITFMIY
jgi:hypothetical protein